MKNDTMRERCVNDIQCRCLHTVIVGNGCYHLHNEPDSQKIDTLRLRNDTALMHIDTVLMDNGTTLSKNDVMLLINDTESKNNDTAQEK